MTTRLMWKARPVDEMSREELLEVVAGLHSMLEEARRMARADAEVERLIHATREAVLSRR